MLDLVFPFLFSFCLGCYSTVATPAYIRISVVTLDCLKYVKIVALLKS